MTLIKFHKERIKLQFSNKKVEMMNSSEESQTQTQIEEEEEGQWKNLTDDILALILKRFNNKADLCRFCSICKSWRLFATPIQPHLQFPLILPPFHSNSGSFSFSPTIIYIFSPNSTLHHHQNNKFWLTRVAETGDNKWAILNPLIDNKLYFLPSGVFRNGINLMGFRNHEVGRSYRLQLISDRGEDDSFDFDEFNSSISLNKVVVVQIGGIIYVLGLFGCGEIGVWNNVDDDWKTIERGKKEKKFDFCDVICFDGKFYAVDRTGRLVTINPIDMEVVEIICSIEEYNGNLNMVNRIQNYNCQYSYLVESNFRLYLVNKMVNPRPTNYYDDDEDEWVVDKSSVGKPLGFKVYVLNEKNHSWDKVKSLGNKVFFVSRVAAFSVNAEDLGWSKGNSIYFEGLTGYDDEADMRFGLNAGVYTLDDEAIVTFDSPGDHRTEIFWPPSSWFVQDEEYPECEMLD